MKQLTFLATISFYIFSFTACSKPIDGDTVNPSRTIRYEVTGNFTGTMTASYTTASGGTANDPVSTLPWNKEITYNSSVTAAIIAFSGNGGAAGQQVSIVIKKGGQTVSTTPLTAGPSGGFTGSAPVVTF
jgi:hypothetical protein